MKKADVDNLKNNNFIIDFHEGETQAADKRIIRSMSEHYTTEKIKDESWCVLISGDADFLEIIKPLKELGLKFLLICAEKDSLNKKLKNFCNAIRKYKEVYSITQSI